MNAKRWGTHNQGCATRPHRLKPVLPSATLRTARKKNTQAKACATKAVLPAGAGPRPVLGMLHQAGGDGIALDIAKDARELPRRCEPSGRTTRPARKTLQCGAESRDCVLGANK